MSVVSLHGSSSSFRLGDGSSVRWKRMEQRRSGADVFGWQVSRHRYSSSTHTTKVSEPSPEEEEGSPEAEETKNTDAAAAPRREGLRPRQGIRPPRLELSSQDYEDDDQNSSDREMGTKGNSGGDPRWLLVWPLGPLNMERSLSALHCFTLCGRRSRDDLGGSWSRCVD